METRLPERSRSEVPGGTRGAGRSTLQPEESEWLDRYRQVLAERYPGVAVSLVLCGSKARGDARKDSDLDVLLIVKTGAAHCFRRAGTGSVRVDGQRSMACMPEGSPDSRPNGLAASGKGGPLRRSIRTRT